MNTTLRNKTGTTLNYTSSFVGYAFTSVSIFGSLGNILVLLVICRQYLLKNNHYTTWYSILQYAICCAYFTGKGWVTSAALCKLLYLHGTFFTAGVLFMVFMAMLRYRAVFYPSRTALRRWKLHLASVTVYMCGVLCQLPVVVNLDFISPIISVQKGGPSKLLDITTGHYLHIVALFNSVLYPNRISRDDILEKFRELIKQREKIKSKREETERWLFQRLVHHRSARTFAITFVIFVCFFVAGSPQQIVIILHTFGVVHLNTYYDWFNVMYYFGVSAVKPLIYGALDKKLFSSFQQCGRHTK
jgi:hypothetical protein